MKMLFGYNFGKLSLAVLTDGQEKAEKGDWQEIDPATLGEDINAAYGLYKDLYRQMKTAKDQFEGMVRAQAGITEVKAQSTAGKKAVSLASFLASQNGAGRSA